MRTLARIFVLLSCTVAAAVGWAQKKNPDKVRSSDVQLRNSGPLTLVNSDVNPRTVFWIQGRFVPVDDPNHQGDAEVVTILCSIREQECLEIDSTNPLKFARGEQAWIEDFKPVNWDNTGILAATRSLDGCTDETLRIRFAQPSVVLINSPVLPMSENCKKINDSWDKLMGKRGSTIAEQTEQDELVPTRGLFSNQDVDLATGKAPTSVRQKKP
ncbi:MAG: hypothetical protein ACYCSP_02305 [Acidobacteriaceae bacterium]